MNAPERKQTVTVFFDGAPHQVKPAEYSGDDLRRLPSPPVKPDKDVWLDIEGGQDRLISPAEMITVTDGLRFFTEVPAITVKIDRENFEVYAKKLTGAELRALPSPDVAADRDLWQDVPDKRDLKVQDEDVIKLHDGIRFFTAPGRINPGASEHEANR